MERKNTVYDTGALLAAENGRREIWTLHSELLAAGFAATVPVAVLAQAWRGGPQAEMSRLLKGCYKQAMDEAVARAAGQACAVTATTDIVDAVVVITAQRMNAVVVTSDPGDLSKIAEAIGVRLHIRTV